MTEQPVSTVFKDSRQKNELPPAQPRHADAERPAGALPTGGDQLDHYLDRLLSDL